MAPRNRKKPTDDTSKPVSSNPPSALWEKIVAMAVGVTMFGVVIWLVVRNQPFADPNLVVILRIALSVAAGVLGGTIPGFLHVTWERKGLAIRSGGALALFVCAYFCSPAVMKVDDRARDKERLLGILDSAQNEARIAVRGLENRWNEEKNLADLSKKGNDGKKRIVFLSTPQLPIVLNGLMNDGLAYPLLSKTFRELLPQLLKAQETLLEGYKRLAVNGPQPEGIFMMLNECVLQEECIDFEMQYQKGGVTRERHEWLIRDALRRQVERVPNHVIQVKKKE